MLRTFCGTQDTSPKSNLAKEKNLSAKHQRIVVRDRLGTLVAIAKAKGLNLRS
jgi:hypothetical protein